MKKTGEMISRQNRMGSWALLAVMVIALPTRNVAAVEINVTVELQGAVEGPFTREVTFVATDASESVLKTWVRGIEFTGKQGMDTLLLVPENMVRLSAKTNFHLRRRVEVTLDENNEGTASFIGDSKLLGGDLNGDNVVDMQDFNRLRYHWFSENNDADITGDGSTGQTDYNILTGNWHMKGDRE